VSVAIDMPDDAHLAQPVVDPDGVRFSRLKLFAESPLHYLANVQGSASHLGKGTAVHALLLGGKRVTYYEKPPGEYEVAVASGREIIIYDKARRGKEWDAFKADHPDALILSPSEHDKCKASEGSGRSSPRKGEDWEKFRAENDDATILSRSEYDVSNRIADAVRANPLAMLALDGIAEETIRFQFLNLPCRSTPDVRARDGAFVTELKTCRSSNPFRFKTQSRWMFYHAQMAFHREAMRRAKMWAGAVPPIPYVVAVCSSAPYPVTVFKMTEQAIELGDKMIRLWFEQLKTCIASKQFPSYSQSVVDLDVPTDDDGLVFADAEAGGAEATF
jgi:hypothetical protein